MGNVLLVDANADASGDGGHLFSLNGNDLKTGIASSNLIDAESPTIQFVALEAHIGEGVVNAAAIFKAPAVLSYCRLGLGNGTGALSYNSKLALIGNTFVVGSVTLTNLGSGLIKAQLFNVGGGLDGNQIDALGGLSPGAFAVTIGGVPAFTISGSGNVDVHSNPIDKVPPPAFAADALSEGNPIGAIMPAPGTFTAMRITPVAFRSLPAAVAGNEGMCRPVNDSTTAVWGATITGGGSNHVMAYSDGTNWTVMGK